MPPPSHEVHNALQPEIIKVVDPKNDEGLKELTETTVQVDDKLYNAETLANFHPGGDVFVKVFAGRDATDAFLSYHRRNFPHDKMKDYLVGKTKSNRDEIQQHDDAEYLELCKLIDEVLPRNQSFAPISYYLKIVGLLTLTFGLEYYIHTHKAYVWYLTALQGLFFAWVGMNIQHDANHGAISRNKYINRYLGLTQNWIGGSALDWIHQHVVQHHIAPNDCEKDPDIVGNAILRLNPLKPMIGLHRFQHLYVFLLFVIFGLTYIFFTIMHVLEGFHFTKMSVLVKDIRRSESLGFVLFLSRWFLLPLYQQPALSTFLNILPMYISGGFYLAFFFVISHNFEGVYLEENGKAVTAVGSTANTTHTTSSANKKDGMGFLRRQVATASNVGGAGLCFINGGLNYQIEHHLFPRIQHNHYPTIAPVVRKFCEQRGIPYIHFPTVSDNVMSCVRHLYTLGHEQYPANFKNTASKVTSSADSLNKIKQQ
jgi:acyl-lipid (7-3)-desaturase (Delta-4 desaturase)